MVPLARAAVQHRCTGQLLKSRSRRAIRRVGADAGLFALDQRLQFFRRRPESELAVEPECAGIDGLVIFMPELVGIDGKTGGAEPLAEELQDPRVQPRGFAFAKGVIQVEADLHSFGQRQAFHISHGHAVLEKHAGVVGADRQAPVAGRRRRRRNPRRGRDRRDKRAARSGC